MAPPHTMKSRTPSATTLIPGLEAMHITSNQLVKSLADELEDATKNKMDGDKSDTESIASRESKECDVSAESDGATSFDESNESMEFISPSKVIGKKEKQDHAIPVEERDGLKTPDQTSTPELDTPLAALHESQLSPADRPIKPLKPLRTKSPRSTSLVPYKSTPAQAKTTDLPFTISDFGFGSTIASPKSSRSSSPAQSIAAALPSSTFDFSFGSAVSSPESSTPSSPLQATPTAVPSTAANKFDFSFGATVATMPLNLNVPDADNVPSADNVPGVDLHHATVDNRVENLGNQMEIMHEKLIDFKSTTAKSIEQLASEHTAALNEIKEMMRNQMKEFQDLREREQASLATALRQKNDLMEELIKVKEAQKASDEENIALKAENRALKETVAKAQEIRQQEQTSITTLSTLNQNLAHEILEVKVAKIISEAENKSLRAENREIKKMMEEENRQCQKLIERLTTKVEFAVTSLVGLHVEKQNESEDEDYGETDEMSDDFMEVLWPQGWEDEGARKRCAINGKVLQRGVLANKPGARVPAGNVGKKGGGWCTVM